MQRRFFKPLLNFLGKTVEDKLLEVLLSWDYSDENQAHRPAFIQVNRQLRYMYKCSLSQIMRSFCINLFHSEVELSKLRVYPYS